MTVLAQPNMQAALLQDNSKARTGLILKKWMETFSGIGNPDMFVEQLDSMQVAAIKTEQMLMQGGAQSMMPQSQLAQTDTTQTEDGVTNPSSEGAK